MKRLLRRISAAAESTNDFKISKGELVEYSGNASKVVIPDGVTSIRHRAFYYCTSITSITIPDSVTTIGVGAFEECKSLTSITIGNGVTTIGDSAFRYCYNLKNITIPNSVTTIDSRAFMDCTSLTSVTIPNSVTSIGRDAFNGTAWYDSQSDGLIYVGKLAYKYKGKCPSKVIIKDGTKGIAVGAFMDCTSLTSVTIPNSVTSIGGVAFSGCTRLKSISIPDGVTTIEYSTFLECTRLTSITIPDSVTSIGNWAFEDCKSLTNITIPDSVTSIAESAFWGCDKLPQTIKNYVSPSHNTEYDDTEYDDTEYDEEMSFEDWYDSSQGEADGEAFVEKLESLVKSNYRVKEFFEEPSIQGYQGGDYIWITLSDGSKYKFVFDWYSEQSEIYSEGPEAAANSYFQEIQDGIDSGSALVEE